MDDNDLLTAVREDFAGVRMTTEAGAVMADGNSLRRRHRRRVYGAGATALAAVAAISTAALMPGSSGAGGAGHAQLTAWTVQKQADGTVDVTIRDLLNLSGLQQKLNADGVPAEISTSADYPASCVNYAAMRKNMASVLTLGPGAPHGYAFVIHPAAIPSGSKLLLDVTRSTTVASGGGTTTRVSGVDRDRLWGLSATSAKDGTSVSAGMGLVYTNGTC